MKNTSFKNLQILLLIFLIYNQTYAQNTREVYVGDEILLVAPRPPQGAIFQTAWAGRNAALKVSKDGVYAAKVTVTDYFSGIAQVQCDYYWYYYLNNQQFTNHATTFFNFRCKQVSVRLDLSSMSLNKGTGAYLYATFSPSNISVKPTVRWNSTNPSVASVTSDGYVRALSPGKTTITVTTNYNTSASCEVIVKDDTPPQPPQPPSGGDDGDEDEDEEDDEEEDDEEEIADQGPIYLDIFLDKARIRIRSLKVKVLNYL